MAKLTIESTIKELLANDQVKDFIDDLIPGFSKNPLLLLAKNKKLKEITDKLDDILDDEMIDKIIKFLEELKD